MKITLLLTPRLVVIISACGTAVVLLLLMLGFELGLRQAHEDYTAKAKSRGDPLYGTNSVGPAKRNARPSNDMPSTEMSGAPALATPQDNPEDPAVGNSMSRETQ